MSDRKNDAYMDIVAILMAAVIMLIMISITEAAASHEQVVGNLNRLSRDHVRGGDGGEENSSSLWYRKVTIHP